MSQLIIPVGIPGCGKSTWGATLLNKSTDFIRSTDQIRETFGDVNDQSNNDLVFARFHEAILEDLQDGFRVYADATNLTKRARTTLLALAFKAQAETHLVVFDNNDQAMYRNLKRERVVPRDVMFRMLVNYERFRLVLPQEQHLYTSVTRIRSYT